MVSLQDLKAWRPVGACIERRWALVFAAAVLLTADLVSISGDAVGMTPAFDSAIYGFGLLLMADGLFLSERRKAAWALLLVGAFPFFIRDGAGAAWLAAGGLIFWHRVQHRRFSLWSGVTLLLLLGHGVMLRPQMAVAIGPLLIYGFAPAIRASRTREWLTASVAIGLSGWAAGIFMGRHLFVPPNGGGDYPFTSASTLLAVPAWLLIGFFFLVLTRGAGRDETRLAARCLALSATLHGAWAWLAGNAAGTGESCWSALALAMASMLVAGARFRS